MYWKYSILYKYNPHSNTMSQEKINLEPDTIEAIQKGVTVVTLLAPLLGPPLALGALTTTIIGGVGLAAAGAAVTVAVAVPVIGKLVGGGQLAVGSRKSAVGSEERKGLDAEE